MVKSVLCIHPPHAVITIWTFSQHLLFREQPDRRDYSGRSDYSTSISAPEHKKKCSSGLHNVCIYHCRWEMNRYKYRNATRLKPFLWSLNNFMITFIQMSLLNKTWSLDWYAYGLTRCNMLGPARHRRALDLAILLTGHLRPLKGPLCSWHVHYSYCCNHAQSSVHRCQHRNQYKDPSTDLYTVVIAGTVHSVKMQDQQI